MKDRALVWTMLGLRGLGKGASRGLCVVGRRLVSCVKECFLEGNEELGVKNALFSVGLSASGVVYVGNMTGVSLVL
jgi:hypothetical protein